MSKQDTHFFNVFSIVLGLLVGFAILVFALARYVGHAQNASGIHCAHCSSRCGRWTRR